MVLENVLIFLVRQCWFWYLPWRGRQLLQPRLVSISKRVDKARLFIQTMKSSLIQVFQHYAQLGVGKTPELVP